MSLHAYARTCPKSRALIARSRTCGDPRERGASGDDLLNRRWVGRPCCGAGARRGSPGASPASDASRPHRATTQGSSKFPRICGSDPFEDAGFACWAQLIMSDETVRIAERPLDRKVIAFMGQTTATATSPSDCSYSTLPSGLSAVPRVFLSTAFVLVAACSERSGARHAPKRSSVKAQVEPEGPLSPLHPLVAAVERRERVESNACLIQASFSSPSRTRGLRCTCA